jgi:hypothetical protein
MLWAGLTLLCWFAYEEAVWQSYAHDRWGRFDLELDGFKSTVLLVASYLMTAGYYLKTEHQAKIANKTQMRLLRFLLLVVSIIFVAVTVVASWVVVVDGLLSKWDFAHLELLSGLLAWMIVILLMARAVYRRSCKI